MQETSEERRAGKRGGGPKGQGGTGGGRKPSHPRARGREAARGPTDKTRRRAAGTGDGGGWESTVSAAAGPGTGEPAATTVGLPEAWDRTREASKATDRQTDQTRRRRDSTQPHPGKTPSRYNPNQIQPHPGTTPSRYNPIQVQVTIPSRYNPRAPEDDVGLPPHHSHPASNLGGAVQTVAHALPFGLSVQICVYGMRANRTGHLVCICIICIYYYIYIILYNINYIIYNIYRANRTGHLVYIYI